MNWRRKLLGRDEWNLRRKKKLGKKSKKEVTSHTFKVCASRSFVAKYKVSLGTYDQFP